MENPRPRVHETITSLDKSKEDGKNAINLDERLQILESATKQIEQQLRHNGLSSKQIETIINGLKAPDKQRLELDQVYEDALLRVQRETNFFHEVGEVGLFADVVEHTLDKDKIAGIKARFSLEAAGDAQYEPVSRTILYALEPSTKEEVLTSLAKDGHLPLFIAAVHHELIHTSQHTNVDRKSINPLKKPKVYVHANNPIGDQNAMTWQEAQAYRTMTGPYFNMDLETLTKDMQYSAIMSRVSWFNKKKFRQAVEIINTLNVLGFEIDEVSALVNELIRESFKKVGQDDDLPVKLAEDAIAVRLEKLGLSTQDLEKLIKIDALERKSASLYVKQLMQEELKKAAKLYNVEY